MVPQQIQMELKQQTKLLPSIPAAVAGPFQIGLERPARPVDDAVDNGLSALEVAIEGRGDDADASGDFGHVEAFQASFGGDFQGGVQDLLLSG